jgi:hypothetical protein
MPWLCQRAITRAEDEAYCLMGTFGVRMLLIYGEGRKGFERLQLEIIKTSSNDTIFTIQGDILLPEMNALPDRPLALGNAHDIILGQVIDSYSITNIGLRIQGALFGGSDDCGERCSWFVVKIWSDT